MLWESVFGNEPTTALESLRRGVGVLHARVGEHQRRPRLVGVVPDLNHSPR